MLIRPHGGTLVNLVLDSDARSAAQARAARAPRIDLSEQSLRDLENIAKGAFSPLRGPMGREDFERVLAEGRLASGAPWTIPIVLDLTREQADRISEGDEIALGQPNEPPNAMLQVTEKYAYSKQWYARQTFGTEDINHPGVARVLALGDVLVGGAITLIRELPYPYRAFSRAPAETREAIQERGWRTICAFQTRDIPHAGHEYLLKAAIAMVDGLMIQPIIGRKQPGDFRDEVILDSYRAIIENYFRPERVLLNTLPTEMRYAGPREAIFHAIIRKNYGCTHILIGPDHAGVGQYYHPEAAIEIFEQYSDLEIQPVSIRGDFFWCHRCGGLASERTCPHDEDQRLTFSAAGIRQMLAEGRTPPPEIIRPEVFSVLARSDNP